MLGHPHPLSFDFQTFNSTVSHTRAPVACVRSMSTVKGATLVIRWKTRLLN